MSERILFQQLGLPIFQNKVYPTSAAAKSAKCGDVELVQSQVSGLVFNRKFNPDLLEYDADYQNEQACSPSFKRHLEEVLELVLRNFGRNSSGVEIGCGKGYFFEMLCGAGANIRGFDPAYEGDNPRVTRRYFDNNSMSEAPDYLVLRHVLEHIPQPWDFLQGLSVICKPGTKIYIEVPCFDWIVANHAFYDIFYEHVNYFTLNSLLGAFPSVFESGRFFGSQYLYLVADLSDFRYPSAYPGEFFPEIPMKADLISLLDRRLQRSRRLFVWGAGAKGITFSNLVLKYGVSIDGIVDINPAKQGRFAGHSGLPILGPEDVGSQFYDADVFIMNPVYFDEIKILLQKFNVNLISVA